MFAGNAAATALKLAVLGNSVTEGVSNVAGGSNLSASAHAIGELAPTLVTTAEQSVSVSSDNSTASKPQICGGVTLPQLPNPFPALSANVACSAVTAAVKGGLPSAQAVGTVAGVTADAHALFNTVLQPIEPALQSIFGALPSQLNPVTSTVSDLLNQLGNTRTLAVNIGNSTSSLTTTAASVTSNATAQGGEVDILGLDGTPLAKIVVGSASAQAVYDRATGHAVPTFNPALVTVTITPPAASGLAAQTLTVAPGVTQTILAGTPLQSTITVAGGSTATNPDGSVTATSAGVELNLLQGLGASTATSYDGGIDLALAKATASVGGTPAVAAVVTPASPSLPFTGSSPVLPIAGMGLLGAGLAGRRVWSLIRH
ncbi:MAG TPA: hypothetical protein VE990_11155 [Acidimicrobiales bacterium]|nr:hypothetical protein [Acidimicrobiales bacterium]